jgi:hypothetical protein
MRFTGKFFGCEVASDGCLIKTPNMSGLAHFDYLGFARILKEVAQRFGLFKKAPETLHAALQIQKDLLEIERLKVLLILDQEKLPRRVYEFTSFNELVPFADEKTRRIVRAAKLEIDKGIHERNERVKEINKGLNSRGMRLLLLAIFLSQTIPLVYRAQGPTLALETTALVCLALFWFLLMPMSFRSIGSGNDKAVRS